MPLVNREVVLAKVESTYKSDASPVAGTDAVLCESISYSPVNVNMVERKAVRESIGSLKPIYGGNLGQLEIVVEVKGSGTAGTPPEMGTLLRGCSFGETIVASTSVTYEPVSTSQESLTLYYYQDGLLRKFLGCMGNVKGELKANDILRATFTFIGHEVDPVDAAMVSPAYDSTVPAIAQNISFTVGGYAADISSLTFDVGNQIATPQSVKNSNGFGDIRIGDKKVIGTIDPEMVLVATKNYVNEWKSGTSAALTTGTIGGTAGNRVAISMPAITYTNVQDGDREGIRTNDISFEANESSGDDEISFVFT